MSVQTISIPEVNTEQGFEPSEVELFSVNAVLIWPLNGAQRASHKITENTTLQLDDIADIVPGAKYRIRVNQSSPVSSFSFNSVFRKAADLTIGTVVNAVYEYEFTGGLDASDNKIMTLTDYAPEAEV